MIEKVNPAHPDKIADRIAGAIVDLAYKKYDDPKIAVEVLIGHGEAYIIMEVSDYLDTEEIKRIVRRIAGDNIRCYIDMAKQDEHLAKNQREKMRCGDNGIFKGIPKTKEEKRLSEIARAIYTQYPYDGKYVLDGEKLIICQSHTTKEDDQYIRGAYKTEETEVNPLGQWTGGLDVDTGATNRKLGSDMGHSVTGGGLHGKDLSKADVSVNIYAYLKAQKTKETVELSCAIGDDMIDGRPYSEIVEIARDYIKSIGGFEKFAEWGLY